MGNRHYLYPHPGRICLFDHHQGLFDRLIVGYAMSQHFSIRMVLQALQSAASNSRSVKGVILQSDQGPQYQSTAYRSLLSQYEIIPPMSRKGNCLDNALTENFFSHLKEELLRHIRIQDFQEAPQVIEDYIHFYNHDRIQLKTYLTPEFDRRQFV
jgi:putative transposase